MNKTFINPFDEQTYKERKIKRNEDIRGPFFRDQTAIIHSLPFRRLKHKTQVFFSPNNDHVCTRIEHAFHVATIAATISKELRLNQELAYAIGLAHDLGHAPFGHAGEYAISNETKELGNFIHEIHGLRVADKLGDRGKSLNLTFGVRDGIICHCGEDPDQHLEPRNNMLNIEDIQKKGILPSSYEGCIARMSDKIAYLGRDLEDALYGGFIKIKNVPDIIKKLGTKNGKIIDTLVIDVINTSKQTGKISISDEKYNILNELSNYSDLNIYKNDKILRYKDYCERIIKRLCEYLLDLYNKFGIDYRKYQESPNPLDNRFGGYLRNMKRLYEKEKTSPKAIVRDYIAGMTDSYALLCMKEISLPEELAFDIVKPRATENY